MGSFSLPVVGVWDLGLGFFLEDLAMISLAFKMSFLLGAIGSSKMNKLLTKCQVRLERTQHEGLI